MLCCSLLKGKPFPGSYSNLGQFGRFASLHSVRLEYRPIPHSKLPASGSITRCFSQGELSAESAGQNPFLGCVLLKAQH